METFDICLFPAREIVWRRDAVTIGGGVPVRGAPRLALTDGGGFWVCEMSGIALRRPEQIRAARAFLARMDNGAATLIVPDPHWHFGPGVNRAMVDATAADDAALRATSITVAAENGLPLEGGEAFSITHPNAGRRYYHVASAGALEDGEQTLSIRPPFREAVDEGDVIDFNTPSCTMRLMNPDDAMSAIRSGRFADFNLVFMEAF